MMLFLRTWGVQNRMMRVSLSMAEKSAHDREVAAPRAGAEALRERVAGVFSVEGPLATDNPRYRPRPGQLDMALGVARTIAHGGAFVVEAGTGVGKTFAYLVPALLSGERILVSTATKNLQDQLFARDLPYLCHLLGLPVRLALLKGRSSYVCTHRLRQARQDMLAVEPAVQHTLARIERFVQSTRSGDLAELDGLDERSPALTLATSTRENCLGSNCPDFRSCYVNQARREALEADVVVVNHHLFFADMAVRESGMAELLPTVQTVIFDEAHQLNETGVMFLGHQLGTSQLLDFCRDTLGAGMQLARGLVEWQTLCGNLERAARDLRLVAGRMPAGARLRWTEPTPEGLDEVEWYDALGVLRRALEALVPALDTVTELAPDFGRLMQRAQLLQKRLEAFGRPCPVDAVRWVEVAGGLRMMQAPLDIAATMRDRVLHLPCADAGDPASDTSDAQEAHHTTQQEEHDAHRAWIFTSATLGDESGLGWFTQPCGLQDVPALRVASPFDYAGHASLYVPPLVRPGDAAHPGAVAVFAARAARALGGRTLVLTTTLRTLRIIGQALRASLEPEGRIEVLIQGESTKRRLIERFRQGAGSDGERGCVLVASASFWEGVDVPGEALQMVVIDKLPFPPPHDPLVEARAHRLETQGKSPFKEYFLPEAAVMLKQGAGRLIRSETDTGILAVCDSRLTQMGYGARLLKALPPMRRLASEEEFARCLKDLAAQRTDPAVSGNT